MKRDRDEHGIFQRDDGLVVVQRHVYTQHALVALRCSKPAWRSDLLKLLTQRQRHIFRPQRVD